MKVLCVSFALLWAVLGTVPALAGYVRVDGPIAAYDSLTDTFSISGGAAIGIGDDPTCYMCIGGQQTLEAAIDETGALHGGNYSLIAISAPSKGINSPRTLLEGTIVSASVTANPGGTSLSSGIDVFIRMITTYVDPLVADWAVGDAFRMCCLLGATSLDPHAYGFPITPDNIWTKSWSGPTASDYSDLISTKLPEPPTLWLFALAAMAAIATGCIKSKNGPSCWHSCRGLRVGQIVE